MNDDMEVLSALVDGEAVDPDRLAIALDQPRGRAALVDFVLLRQAMSESASSRPTEGFASRARARLGLDRRRLAGWLTAAALLLALLVVPRWLDEPRERLELPEVAQLPTPTKTIRLDARATWRPASAVPHSEGEGR